MRPPHIYNYTIRDRESQILWREFYLELIFWFREANFPGPGRFCAVCTENPVNHPALLCILPNPIHPPLSALDSIIKI